MRITRRVAADIKKRLCNGEKQESLASDYGCSRSLISDIATGRAHSKIPWPEGSKYAVIQGGRKKIDNSDPTNFKILELEAELVSLKDEYNKEKKKVKAGAKVAGLFQAIVEEMNECVKPIKELPSLYKPCKKGAIVEHCVLHLSDWHADEVVKPEEVGGMEEFNFPIACRRAEHLIETTIDWTKNTLSPKFDFPVLWMLVYGDLSSGTIHKAAERSYYRNQFRNSVAIGTLFSLMVRDLSPHFEQVNVVCISGNHGRTTPKKDFGGPLENFDYLIAEIARMNCKEMENVSWLIPNSWSVNLDINGIGMNVSHGDDVRSNSGMPWYSMVRRQKNLMALDNMQGGLHTRYWALGHHHLSGGLSDMDCELLLNGSWVGTDQYSFNSFSGYREPNQLLHGMNPKYGATWRLPVKLKTEGEKDGPKRYLIDGGREVGPL